MSEVSAQEAKSSSWFSSLSLPTNLSNKLTNLSTTFVDATSKVGNAANTFQKSIQERFYTSDQNEPTPTTTKSFSSMFFLFFLIFENISIKFLQIF